jgi:hypothetical protein
VRFFDSGTSPYTRLVILRLSKYRTVGAQEESAEEEEGGEEEAGVDAGEDRDDAGAQERACRRHRVGSWHRSSAHRHARRHQRSLPRYAFSPYLIPSSNERQKMSVRDRNRVKWVGLGTTPYYKMLRKGKV